MKSTSDLTKYETVASDENQLGELDESGAKSTNVAHDSSTLETHSDAKDLIKSTSDLTKYETVASDEKQLGELDESGESQCVEFTELLNGDFQKYRKHQPSPKRGRASRRDIRQKVRANVRKTL